MNMNTHPMPDSITSELNSKFLFPGSFANEVDNNYRHTIVAQKAVKRRSDKNLSIK
jgi:hypothetical protein